MKRLKSYKLFESNFDVSQIKSIIEEDCKKFLDEVGGTKFYRGFKGAERYEVMPGLYHIYNTKARSPKDTKIEVSDLLDDHFEKKFGVRPRKDAVFTTRDTMIASDYGKPFIFFPIGEYTYLYNLKIIDLYNYLEDIPWYLDEAYYWMQFGEESGNGVWSIGDYDFTDEWYESLEMAISTIPELENKTKKSVQKLLIWKPDISYKDWKKQQDKDMMEDIKDIVAGYKDSELSSIESLKSSTGAKRAFPEVMFLCDEYYLVDPDINLFS